MLEKRYITELKDFVKTVLDGKEVTFNGEVVVTIHNEPASALKITNLPIFIENGEPFENIYLTTYLESIFNTHYQDMQQYIENNRVDFKQLVE